MNSEKKPLVYNDHYSTYSSIPDVVVNQSRTPDGQPEISYVQDGIIVAKSTRDEEEPQTKVRKFPSHNISKYLIETTQISSLINLFW